jgi:hypothetical protein
MPGVPVDGGTLAEGTKIRNCIDDGDHEIAREHFKEIYLVKVIVQLWTKGVDQVRNLVGQFDPRRFELIQGSLLSWDQCDYKRSQGSGRDLRGKMQDTQRSRT